MRYRLVLRDSHQAFTTTELEAITDVITNRFKFPWKGVDSIRLLEIAPRELSIETEGERGNSWRADLVRNTLNPAKYRGWGSGEFFDWHTF
jgi:hypothetical protein